MTTPRVGMHSLPTELKQQIVRCCADQDALLERSLEDLGFGDGPESLYVTPLRLVAARQVAARNRSLVALAAVSRQWNDLVAPVLFEALPYNKTRSHQFMTRILPRRGHLFVRLTGSWERDGYQLTDVGDHLEDLTVVLPKLLNLKELCTPDLMRVAQKHHREVLQGLATDPPGPDAEDIRACNREFQQQEDALVGMLRRAESIMHPDMTPEDLLASFKKLYIDGDNLKHLELTTRSARSQRSDLTKALKLFPNLESLTIHVKLFNYRSVLNRILVDDPVFKPGRVSLPRLRKLSLMGFYEGDEAPKVRPSSAPLLRLAQPFANTLEGLVLDVRLGDFTEELDEDSELDDDNAVVAATTGAPRASGSQLAFTSPFPLLRRLTLQGLPSAFEHLLPSIDSKKLPALEACLCDFKPVPKDNGDEDDKAVLDLADAPSRIPGFELAPAPAQLDLMTRHLVEYVRQPDEKPDRYTRREPTWPKPLLQTPPDADATRLREELEPTLDHLNDWYRHARDANDTGALQQIRDALEAVHARRTVMEAWTAVGGPDSRAGDA